MKTKLTLMALIGITIAVFSGYKWGYSRGEEGGMDAGSTNVSLINCVYLTHAFQNEDSGDQVSANDKRHRLLLGSALNLDYLASNDLLNADDTRSAERVVRDVVAYYQKSPQSLECLDRHDDLTKLKPEVLKLLAKHKTAEQVEASDSLQRRSR